MLTGMILADVAIQKYLASKKIKITPKINFATQLGSCSVDLRLGKKFRIFRHSSTPILDPYNPQSLEDVTEELIITRKRPFVLHPGEFALAVTEEYVEIPDDICAQLEGRSSIGRMGVVIHSTAGNIEAGFKGKITLELANMGRIPVMLYPGMRICALVFQQLSSPAKVPYNKKKGAKYLGHKGPEPSKITQEA